MGTTSDKLTYLNDTKQLLKENINNLGGNLTTEPFRQYASVLEGIYERIPKVSGIGTNLSLSPTMVGKIKLNEIYGDTLQDGTPTPSSPVPIENVTGLQNINVCGKNLFDKDNASIINAYFDGSHTSLTSANTNRTTYCKVQPNTTYTISKLKSIRSFIGTAQTLPEIGTQISNISNIGSGDYDGTTRISGTITTGANDNYIVINYANINTDTGDRPTTILQSIQIEVGNQATTYEPYTGNTYEVNLGKNLLNAIPDRSSTNGVTATQNDDKSITLNGTSTANSWIEIDYNIKLSPCEYTLSIKNKKTGLGLYLGTGSDTTYAVTQNQADSYKTFTLENETTFDKARIRIISGTVFENFTIYPQLEKGTQVTEYSPYFEPIELNKIGDYQDRIYKSNNKWYIEKNTKKTQLAIADMNNSENYPGWTGQTQLKNDVYNGTNVGSLNYYTSFYNNIEEYNSEEIRVNFNNQEVLFIRKNKYNYTQTQWKTNYPDLIFEIIYNLTKSEYIEITNTELINQLETLASAKSMEEQTNITVTSEDLFAILNVSALKGE